MASHDGQIPVAVSGPGPDGIPDVSKVEIFDVQSPGVRQLGLAAKTVHADDGIAAHRAVAPAMHVSTTYRYNDDPEKLQSWDNIDVSIHGVRT
jgi:hypothetical protein